ncbi:hypothetical protein AHIS2_p004 [Acaryochloris phage A-HIS2]|nr:hypothetical protein AHIS2_p004 [Acaryochloris phage A-HIS2]
MIFDCYEFYTDESLEDEYRIHEDLTRTPGDIARELAQEYGCIIFVVRNGEIISEYDCSID